MKNLLKEAQRKYPPGTEIKSAQSGGIWTITKDAQYNIMVGDNVRCWINNRTYNVFLRWNGEWSEIIKSGEPVINNQYEIY